MRRTTHKLGQMEVIGLVVIVLLISLGMIFMAIFALKTADDKKIFTRKELATSTLAAILKTTITDESCYDAADRNRVPLPLGEKILEDCVLHSPPSSSDYNCQGADGLPQHSCAFFEQTVTTLLDQSLGQATPESLHKRYEMKITVIQAEGRQVFTPIDPILSLRGGCPKSSAGKDRDSSKPFPLQVEGIGIVQAELYICD
ncbi:hypothetical protein HYV86_05490 [Candidatus Woesearchaeota archaeon]|nr:hypothetical protein [Candidatus Woesearchaeota archaeon]